MTRILNRPIDGTNFLNLRDIVFALKLNSCKSYVEGIKPVKIKEIKGKKRKSIACRFLTWQRAFYNAGRNRPSLESSLANNFRNFLQHVFRQRKALQMK